MIRCVICEKYVDIKDIKTMRKFDPYPNGIGPAVIYRAHIKCINEKEGRDNER